jgi:hypothetical protein
MYAALFLIPWVLIYAISSLVMNHSAHFPGRSAKARFQLVSEQIYQGSVSNDASPEMVALQLLADLRMEGLHQARFDQDTGEFVIRRESPAGIHRITYDRSTQKLTVEKSDFEPREFLSKIHRRRGFDSEYLKDDLYGLVVDAFVIIMLVWIFSGIWMWWHLNRTRVFGWLSVSSGVLLFAFFLLMI